MRGGPLGKHAVGELLWLLPVSSVRSQAGMPCARFPFREEKEEEKEGERRRTGGAWSKRVSGGHINTGRGKHPPQAIKSKESICT